MELVDLQAMAEKERSARKPVRIRCCTAASCLWSGSMKVKEAMRLIQRDGWYQVKSQGGHRQYKHP